jgi:drug/metabolite transporter (DMT)-like permease
MTIAVTTRQWHTLAVLMAVAANFLLAVMSSAVKWLTLKGYPTFQITFTNGCIGLVSLSAFFAATGKFPRLKVREPLLAGYVAVALGACFCLFRAYGTGQIAEVSMVVASAPLMTAVLCYFFLHERLTRYQALLALAGFAGVLLVLKPRPDMGSPMPLLLALAGTFFFACSQVLVKKLVGKVYTFAMNFYFYAALVVLAGILAPFKAVDPAHMPGFALSGCCDVVSLALLYTAFTHAPVSLVAPFNYSNTLWTMLFGYLMWSENIDAFALAGAAVVIAAGIAFTHTLFGNKTNAA